MALSSPHRADVCDCQLMSETPRPTLTRRAALKTFTVAAGVGLTASWSRLGAAEAASAGGPVATTAHGKVRGYIDSGINVFKGVPYGDDTAKMRFAAPRPPVAWTGVRDALRFGPRAPQPGRSVVYGTYPGAGPADETMSEDCLTLNLWTPSLRDNGRRAVMVYFHGGGYNALSGNDAAYDGVRLCHRGDVVVVTVNHRLNAFGYLYLAELGGPQFADSGNVGQLDLIFALRWIRENIAEFGGDPQRVLIFGESGGGAKNACLMGMPSAIGLFQRAASSSGETVTASRPATATARAELVLKALGLTRDNLAEIRRVPMERLVQASRATNYYGPVVDGGVLPRHPFDPDAPAFSAHIPFMVGTNKDESRFFLGRGNNNYWDLTWETLPAALSRYSEKMGDLKMADVIATYRRAYPDYSATDVFFAATTDSRDWRPALVEIERRAALPNTAAPTYSYELRWPSPITPRLRAHHTLDIPLMFDNVAFSPQLTGTSPEAYAMAEIMSETYIAFAKTGNPNNRTIPNWPAYDVARRATMAFDLPSHVIDDPRREPRKLFSPVPYENPGT
jgi:para-nitrobenzyl esterase